MLILITFYFRFTDTFLAKLQNLESIHFEAVTADDDFCKVLFDNREKIASRNKVKELTLALGAPEVVDDEWFERL